jgi:hypothetical protein
MPRDPQLRSIAGLVSAEDTPPEELERRCQEMMAPAYSHEEVFGAHCFLAEHIAAPYPRVFDYCADIHSLEEWTLNIRNLQPVDGAGPAGLHRGHMVFSPEDAAHPSTDIYIRADVMRGPEHGVICYPCAWDQADELWMRYYFVLADSALTLGRPGTVVMWTNCRHRYYDKGAEPVPESIRAGRARSDRFWPGDGWPLFHALHRLELGNLKRIAEHRLGQGGG